MPLTRRGVGWRRKSVLDPKTWNLKSHLLNKLEDMLDSRIYNDWESRPPFSLPEMMVIAMVMSQKESLLATELMAEVFKCFKYYGFQAIDDLTKARKQTENYELDFRCVYASALGNFNDGVDCFEAPFYDAKNNAVVTGESARKEDVRISCPINEAALYLRKYQGYDRPYTTGQSRKLLDLPNEMISKIFEAVLVFDSPGLLVRPKGYRVLKRKDEQFEYDTDNPTLELPPTQELLALLSVSKFCYYEGLKVFYSGNTFIFDTIHEFAKFVKGTTKERLAKLRNVTVNYLSTFRGLYGFVAGAKTISNGARLKLKRFELVSLDASWFDKEFSQKVGGHEVFASPESLPGIHDLAFALSNATSFIISNNCPRIKKFLHTEIAKIKLAKDKKEIEALKQAPSMEELIKSRPKTSQTPQKGPLKPRTDDHKIQKTTRAKGSSFSSTRSDSGLNHGIISPKATSSSSYQPVRRSTRARSSTESVRGGKGGARIKVSPSSTQSETRSSKRRRID